MALSDFQSSILEVRDKAGRPFKGDPKLLPEAIAAGEVVFHEGRICGAWPRVL